MVPGLRSRAFWTSRRYLLLCNTLQIMTDSLCSTCRYSVHQYDVVCSANQAVCAASFPAVFWSYKPHLKLQVFAVNFCVVLGRFSHAQRVVFAFMQSQTEWPN